MKLKFSKILYGLFELLIAVAAFATGGLMILNPNGAYRSFPPEFPQEWLTKVPFNNWFIPGIIAILIFGLGNFLAGINNFIKSQKHSGIIGIIMGSLLLISIIAQMLILDVYLISVECLIIGIVQLGLGVHLLKGGELLKKKIAIILIIVLALLSYGVYWAFYHMGRLPKGEFITEVQSPDGKYTIKAYVSEGTLSAPAVRAELNYNEKIKKSKNIYWNYREDHANIEWIDNVTVIINNHKLNVIQDIFDWRRED
ncbi:hypothetical protein SH2C18_44670 [Clostridium sediminicola]|uniref:DUF5412 domain-containing protein n=1 Tax=Clostridium sediminicola TaxID=3114879 RepID=UPI0031F27E69